MQREGQAHSPTKSGWDSADVKAYKCIQMIALRKASGIVRFWEGWFGMKNGGTIPPVVARIFFGRQHLTFDKGRAWMPEVERPKFCRTQNKQSVHMASVLAIFEG